MSFDAPTKITAQRQSTRALHQTDTVNGIPLTVVRKYDSLAGPSGDFGLAWSMSINDMDVQLDENRAVKPVVAFNGTDSGDGGHPEFSVRTGGGRNVSLTLPDGRRGDFLFSPQMPFTAEKPYALARWLSPPGVTASLVIAGTTNTPNDEDPKRRINFSANGINNAVWSNGEARTPFEAYDIPGFDLILKDGTKFELRRDPDFGTSTSADWVTYDATGSGLLVPVSPYSSPLKLRNIVQPSGDRVEIKPDGISHHLGNSASATRNVTFIRDERGRISALTDPLGNANLPAVRYLYNDDKNLLVQVLRLINRTTGEYATNRYYYDHAKYPNYLTRIVNARGVTVARNEYDDSGRLTAIINASNQTNRITRDLATHSEIRWNPSNKSTTYRFDSRGNVTNIVDALGKTNRFEYNQLGVLTNRVDALGYSTTYDVNSTNGLVNSVTLPYPAGADPGKYRTSFVYDAADRLSQTTLPTGGTLQTVYHPVNGWINSEIVGTTTIWSSVHDSDTGRLTAESDVFGTTGYTAFDAAGNATTIHPPVGPDITSQFDANNQVTDVTTTKLQGGTTTSHIVYDALGREKAVTYSSNLAVNYDHVADLDWGHVSAPTLGSMERRFDEQNRLSGWTTANGSRPGFQYDQNGLLQFETNNLSVVTEYQYDDVGRLWKTINKATTATTENHYFDNGWKQWTKDAALRQTTFDYWPDGSLKSMIDPANKTWSYSYEIGGGCCGGTAAGSRTIVDPLGRVTIEKATEYGLPKEVVRKSSVNTVSEIKSSTSYPPNLVSPDQEAQKYPQTITDEGGRIRTFQYLPDGRLNTATDLGGKAYQNEYSSINGAWLRVKSPPVILAGSPTPVAETLQEVIAWDDWDREKVIKLAGLAGTSQIFYESEKPTPINGASHLPYKIVSPSGDRVEFDYKNDGSGRVDRRRTFKFDAATNVSTQEENLQFSYTANDAMESVTNLSVAAGTGETRYQYDSAGRLTSIKFPTGSLNGAQLGYSPDILDRVTKVKVKTSSGGREYLLEYLYHINGQIEFIKVYDPTTASPNTIALHTTTFTYDDVGRVSTRTHSMAGITAPISTYSYKTPVANVTPGGWTEYAVNDLVTHIDHSRASASIVRLTYERLPGGEPQKVWYNENPSGVWNAGEFVTMTYANGLRVGSEDWSTTADLTYSYNDAGSRLTRALGAAVSTATYKPGFQINAVTVSGGAASETWDYDAGGRVKTLNRGVSRSLTWTAVDQLKTATVNGVVTTYKYDPLGRRIEAAKTGGATRRFIIGPTAGTGLEVIHAVADASGTLQALYVYHGDRPIVRFTVDATGKPVNPVYYLEDAQGSVVALTDATGASTRFRYDAFGVPRTDASHADPTTAGIPAGTGGDFRFHGLWLEADTGFYYARARDYDPPSGTFLSRDPAEGATTAPESYHAYNFADSNPLVYKDPTGRFSVVEINVSGAIESSLQSFKSAAMSRARGYVTDQIVDSLTSTATRALSSIFPEMGMLLDGLDSAGNNYSKRGTLFEKHVLGRFCGALGGSVGSLLQHVTLYPGIEPETGAARSFGIHCPLTSLGRLEKYLKYPDFVLGDQSLSIETHKSWLIGDVKLSGNSLYNQYYKQGSRNKFSQFQAIVNYAQQHTHTRTALFITFLGGDKSQLKQISKLLGKEGLQHGVVVFVFSTIPPKGF